MTRKRRRLIFVLLGLAMLSLATAMVPSGLILTGVLVTTGARVTYPSALDFSPQYGVPRLPPRRRA